METIACEFCLHSGIVPLFQKQDKYRITSEPFQVVECSACSLRFVSPRPDSGEILKYYPETYSWREEVSPQDSWISQWSARFEKFYRYHLLRFESRKILPQWGKAPGRLLDVGAGTGDRLNVLRELGFSVTGVEPSDQADYAQKHFGLDVRKGDLFSAAFPDESFDLVTLFNVLEHTHSPSRVMNEVDRILAPGGLVVIQVPNTDSWQAEIFKARWAAVDVPRDLFYFRPSTLNSLFETSGFSVKKIDLEHNWWHPPTLVISAFPDLDPQLIWRSEGRAKGSSVLARVGWALATFLAAPLAYLEARLGRGVSMTCYGVKS